MLVITLHFYRYAHKCGQQRRMRIAQQGRSTKVADNHVILTTGEMVKVTKKDGAYFEGYALRISRISPAVGDVNLPFHMVGLHKYEGVRSSEVRRFKYEDVRGKAMICGNIISEWLPEWFMSKLDV